MKYLKVYLDLLHDQHCIIHNICYHYCKFCIHDRLPGKIRSFPRFFMNEGALKIKHLAYFLGICLPCAPESSRKCINDLRKYVSSEQEVTPQTCIQVLNNPFQETNNPLKRTFLHRHDKTTTENPS